MKKVPNKEPDLHEQIAAACVGLVFISETDSPVVPFFGQRPAREHWKTIEFANFFDRLTAKKEWHQKTERRNAEGFRKLQKLLEAELDDLTVYKYGNIQVDIFVLGRDKNGKTAGVRMKAVET